MAEYLRVISHVGFLFAFTYSDDSRMAARHAGGLSASKPTGGTHVLPVGFFFLSTNMTTPNATPDPTIAAQLAAVARKLQAERTGHAPKAVTAVLSEDTLVVTLHEALTPAEKILIRSPEGAAQVQEFHRQLFASSDERMRQEIKRLTGRTVRDATAEIETETGAIVHAFTTGAMVQVYLLTTTLLTTTQAAGDQARAADDGMPQSPNAR